MPETCEFGAFLMYSQNGLKLMVFGMKLWILTNKPKKLINTHLYGMVWENFWTKNFGPKGHPWGTRGGPRAPGCLSKVLTWFFHIHIVCGRLLTWSRSWSFFRPVADISSYLWGQTKIFTHFPYYCLFWFHKSCKDFSREGSERLTFSICGLNLLP